MSQAILVGIILVGRLRPPAGRAGGRDLCDAFLVVVQAVGKGAPLVQLVGLRAGLRCCVGPRGLLFVFFVDGLLLIMRTNPRALRWTAWLSMHVYPGTAGGCSMCCTVALAWHGAASWSWYGVSTALPESA